MKFAPSSLFLFALAALGTAASAGTARADTVRLKNGAEIEGQVTDNRQTTGEVIVRIGENGIVTLRAGQVDSIGAAAARGEPATPPAEERKDAVPAVERGRVTVTAPAGADWYGERVYEGVLLPESNDKMIVLEVPGPGKVFIQRGPETIVKKVEATGGAPMPAAASTEGGVIKTSHTIHLKNGRKLSGTLVPTPDSEPIQLQVGGLGVLKIDRSQVAEKGIKEVQGAIRLPAPPAAEPAAEPAGGAEPAKPVVPDAIREQIKKEVRAEILRELLDRMIDEKIESAVQPGAGGVGVDVSPAGLSNDEILAIQDAVRELGRQRTQNRVRAERQLKRMGSAALAFLAPAAKHPFDLTRRAVQRIVRDLGDARGAPLAIEALNDPDLEVRMLAREALEAVLPSDIAYDPRGDERDLLDAQRAYMSLWDEYVRSEARNSILKGIAGN